MAGPDLSLITNAPNLTDRIMQQQANTANIQTAQVDARQKQNAYATQVMSAAAASGDPAQYIKGKQLLASQGIDVSNWSDDPTVGAQQAQAARMALISPLGMLNSEIQLQRNGIQASGVNGTMAPTGVPSLGMPVAATSNVQAPSSQGTPLPQSAPAANIPVFTQSASGQTPSNAPPSLNAPVQSPAASIPQQPTQDDPKYAGLNPKTRKEAFEADLQAWSANPLVKGAQTQSESFSRTAGENAAKAQDNALNSDQATGIVQQNIQGIIDLAKRGNLPEGETAPISSAGYNLVAPHSDTAQDSKSFNTLNESQTIGAIRDLASTGQIKMSRTLENIINRGYLVDPTASNDEKIVQANIIMNELKNSAIAAKNVSAQLNGGQQMPFVPMTVAPNATPAVNGWSAVRVK